MKKDELFSYAIFYMFIIAAAIISAILLNNQIRVASSTQPLNKRTCIIIDAGHGGIDGGAVSLTGAKESCINLEIALRLNDLLLFLGHNTKMIRTSDISVHTDGQSIAQIKVSDLKNRVNTVNATRQGLLLSIHQNSFPEQRYKGAQIFYASTAGSEQLAKQIQTAFCSTINIGSRRLAQKGANVYLLDHINVSGVLIECGFLSNPEEERNLRTEGYQKMVSIVIASTLSTYLDQSVDN